MERRMTLDVGIMPSVVWKIEEIGMSIERETLASNFADARAHGLIDIKFFALASEDLTVDQLCAAANNVESAIRDGHVVDFEVDDEGMVASNLDELLYS
jgi:hypothetical protein